LSKSFRISGLIYALPFDEPEVIVPRLALTLQAPGHRSYGHHPDSELQSEFPKTIPNGNILFPIATTIDSFENTPALTFFVKKA